MFAVLQEKWRVLQDKLFPSIGVETFIYKCKISLISMCTRIIFMIILLFSRSKASCAFVSPVANFSGIGMIFLLKHMPTSAGKKLLKLTVE